MIDRSEIEGRALALRSDLSGHRGTAIVTAIFLSEARRNADVKGRSGEGQVEAAEYLSLLLWPELAKRFGEVPSAAVVADAFRRASEIIGDAQTYEVESERVRQGRTLHGRARSAGLRLRNPGISSHWQRLLDAFARDFDPRIERALGVSLLQCIQIQNAIRECVTGNLTKWRQKGEGRAQALWTSYRRGRHSWRKLADDERALLESIDDESGSYRKRIFAGVWELELSTIDSVLTVAPDDVARIGSVDAERTRRMLDLFALPGDIPLDRRLLPSAYNYLSRTPVVKLDDGYFVPHPSLLQWALLPRIEMLLNPSTSVAITKDQTHFQGYEQQRRRFLEGTAADIFSRLSSSRAMKNVAFALASEQSSVRYEVDVCAVLDTTAYIVECKAGTLSEAARRGAEQSVKSDLRDLLVDANRQASRAIECLQRPDDVVTTSNVLDFIGNADEFIAVIVTLDHTGSLTTDIEALREQRLFGRSGPWIVSLLDLYTVADLLEAPWRFKHYAHRRTDILRDDRTVIAFDELDFYEMYRHFNVCAFPPGGAHTVFLAPTNDIDMYYNQFPGHAIGKPVRKAPRLIRELVADLAACGAIGWTDVASDLLDLNNSTQAHLAKSMQRMQTQAALGAELPVSRIYDTDHGYGLAYCATTDILGDDTMRLAHAYLIDLLDDVKRWLVVVHNPTARAVTHGVYEKRDGRMILSGKSLRLGEGALTMKLERRRQNPYDQVD